MAWLRSHHQCMLLNRSSHQGHTPGVSLRNKYIFFYSQSYQLMEAALRTYITSHLCTIELYFLSNDSAKSCRMHLQCRGVRAQGKNIIINYVSRVIRSRGPWHVSDTYNWIAQWAGRHGCRHGDWKHCKHGLAEKSIYFLYPIHWVFWWHSTHSLMHANNLSYQYLRIESC